MSDAKQKYQAAMIIEALYEMPLSEVFAENGGADSDMDEETKAFASSEEAKSAAIELEEVFKGLAKNLDPNVVDGDRTYRGLVG